MRLFRVRCYRRTCRACGHTWEIARALAREARPSPRELARLRGRHPLPAAPFGTLLGRGRAGGAAKGGHEATLDDVVAERRRLLERLDRIDRNSRCPECGSKEFGQKRV